MNYHVIYDGNCNLCVSLVQVLENLDKGELFDYISMQEEETLSQFGVTAEDCQMGMILIDAKSPHRRWQGSEAAEEIGRLLPVSNVVVAAYRAMPGLKWVAIAFMSKCGIIAILCLVSVVPTNQLILWVVVGSLVAKIDANITFVA